MKYTTKTEENGDVTLHLGLNHGITFEKGMSVDDVVLGVQVLIEKVTGVSAFELVHAVLLEQGAIDKEGNMLDQPQVEPANG